MSRSTAFIRLVGACMGASLAATVLAQSAVPSAPAARPTPTPSATSSPAAAPSPVPSPSAVAAITPATSAPTPDAALAGNWDLRIDGVTIFRFAIGRTASGGWQGRWSRPDAFNSNGNAFANLRGPVKATGSMTGNAVFELVELAFDDPRPGAVPDIFRFRLIGPNAVDMTYVGTQLPPYRLVRAAAGDPLGNWEAGRVYRRPAPSPRPITTVTAVPTIPPPIAVGAPVTVTPPVAVAAPPRSDPATAPPRVIVPTPDGRIILGRQVQFLDLTPREQVEPATPAPDAPATAESGDTVESANEAARPEAERPRIDADFMDDL